MILSCWTILCPFHGPAFLPHGPAFFRLWAHKKIPNFKGHFLIFLNSTGLRIGPAPVAYCVPQETQKSLARGVHRHDA